MKKLILLLLFLSICVITRAFAGEFRVRTPSITRDRSVVRALVFLQTGLAEKEARKNYGRSINLRNLPEDLDVFDGRFDFCVQPGKGFKPKYSLEERLAQEAEGDLEALLEGDTSDEGPSSDSDSDSDGSRVRDLVQ